MMCEKEKEKDLNTEETPKEKDLISAYTVKKIQYYLLMFVVCLIVIGSMLSLLPEEASTPKEILSFEFYFLVVVLFLYTFFSFVEKASEVDLAKITGLLAYTQFSIFFYLPTIQASLDYLDLSSTGDFLRLASSIIIVLGAYPIIYLLGKFILKQNITIEEYQERKKLEKEKENEEIKEK
jgi:hypothetical protein